MKTYAKYDPEKQRVYPVTVDGATRWAESGAALHLAYGTKPVNTAMYADGLGGFRGFALHQFDGQFWTVSNDGTWADKLIARGWVPFDRLVRQYDADPRWQLVAEESADSQ